MSAYPWPLAPETLALFSDEVHVWRASLDLPSAWRSRLQQTLSPDELERAKRFRFERDRRRYVVRRGMLRDILGRYLGVEAGELRFVYSAHGKPDLAPLFERDALNRRDGLFIYQLKPSFLACHMQRR